MKLREPKTGVNREHEARMRRFTQERLFAGHFLDGFVRKQEISVAMCPANSLDAGLGKAGEQIDVSEWI